MDSTVLPRRAQFCCLHYLSGPPLLAYTSSIIWYKGGTLFYFFICVCVCVCVCVFLFSISFNCKLIKKERKSKFSENMPNMLNSQRKVFLEKKLSSLLLFLPLLSCLVSWAQSCRAGQFYLTTLFLGRLSSCYSQFVHSLSLETDVCPSCISGRERMAIENIP